MTCIAQVSVNKKVIFSYNWNYTWYIVIITGSKTKAYDWHKINFQIASKRVAGVISLWANLLTLDNLSILASTFSSLFDLSHMSKDDWLSCQQQIRCHTQKSMRDPSYRMNISFDKCIRMIYIIYLAFIYSLSSHNLSLWLSESWKYISFTYYLIKNVFLLISTWIKCYYKLALK